MSLFRSKLGLTALIPAVLSVGYLAHPATAASVFMNINFSGDTIGSAPAVTYPAAPTPVTKPYAIGGYNALTVDPFGDNPPTAADGTVTVQNAGTMSNAALMTTNSLNNQTGALWLDTQYLQTGSQIKLSFDLDIVDSAAAINADPTFQFALNGDINNLVGLVFAANQFSNDGTIFDFGAAPTSATGGLFGFRNPNQTDFNSFFSYNNGDTYHIEIDGNYDTHTVSASVNGIQQISNYAMRAGQTSNLLTESFFFVDGQPGTANSVALDNIVASVSVPLPTSAWMGLVLLGGLTITQWRRATRLA